MRERDWKKNVLVRIFKKEFIEEGNVYSGLKSNLKWEFRHIYLSLRDY